MKEKIKSIRGMTLIALVVTIVVLLILAAVSIGMLTGENGIITQAQKSKEETIIGEEREKVELAAIAAAAKDKMIEIKKENLVEELNTNIGEEKYTLEGEGPFLVTYNDSGRSYDVDTNGKVTSGDSIKIVANEPKLSSGMIPVRYDTDKEKWIICSSTDEKWYSYTSTDKKWANVMLCDGTYDTSTPVGTEVAEEDLGSMFVWIPRYAYKISDGYHSGSGTIDVVWVRDNGFSYVDNEGNIQKAKNGNTDGVITASGYTDYVVHPSFTDGSINSYSNGEWKSEISGIWVAKFQAGIYTTEKDTTKKVASVKNYYYPVFKGRKYGYNYVSESECYNLSLALSNTGNPYGLTNLSNSHLIKSSEWGAVAYLSISKYGYSGGTATVETEKYRNNLDLNGTVAHPNNSSWKIYGITGYSATGAKTARNTKTFSNSAKETLKDSIGSGSTISYAWTVVEKGKDSGSGTKSSTTGNIYGIFDMSCGLAEYTAAYINNLAQTNNGSAFATGTSTHLATAYTNEATTEIDFNKAYAKFSGIFGDAIWETSSDAGKGKAWFGDTLDADTWSIEVFFPRGGDFQYVSNSGLCGLYDNAGYYADNCGFRSVLIVE